MQHHRQCLRPALPAVVHRTALTVNIFSAASLQHFRLLQTELLSGGRSAMGHGAGVVRCHVTAAWRQLVCETRCGGRPAPCGCSRAYREPSASSSTRHTCGGTRHAPSRQMMRSCCSPLSTCAQARAADCCDTVPHQTCYAICKGPMLATQAGKHKSRSTCARGWVITLAGVGPDC